MNLDCVVIAFPEVSVMELAGKVTVYTWPFVKEPLAIVMVKTFKIVGGFDWY